MARDLQAREPPCAPASPTWGHLPRLEPRPIPQQEKGHPLPIAAASLPRRAFHFTTCHPFADLLALRRTIRSLTPFQLKIANIDRIPFLDTGLP